jgi:hypothetical protein
MSESDSEQLIRTFRNDDLATQNPANIQKTGYRGSKPRQPVSSQQSLPMRRPGGAQPNPFRCSTCGNTQLRAFATMYAQGTSTAISKKGWLQISGYQKTWRQTEIARICAPPRRKKFWPALLLVIIAALGTFAVYTDFMTANMNTRIMEGSFLLGWLGISLGAYHFYWNLRQYPASMKAYGRLFYCQRCATVTRI